MSTDTLDSRDVSHCLSVEIGLSDQVVLDVAEHQAVMSISVHEMAHALHVIEFSLREVSFHVSLLAISNLLDEPVCSGIKDEEAVVGGVSDDKKLFDTLVGQGLFTVRGPQSDELAGMAHILTEGQDRFGSDR